MSAIYKITNLINRKIYIGQTIGDVNKRLKRHFSQMNCKNICSALYSAFYKYGKDNFIIESIVTGSYTKEELNELEAFYIKKFNSLSPVGYNLQSGGNSFMVAESVKKQTSNSLKGRKVTWGDKVSKSIKLLWENKEYRELQTRQRYSKRGKYKDGIIKPLRLELDNKLINSMYKNGESIYKISKKLNVSFYTIKKRIVYENK